MAVSLNGSTLRWCKSNTNSAEIVLRILNLDLFPGQLYSVPYSRDAGQEQPDPAPSQPDNHEGRQYSTVYQVAWLCGCWVGWSCSMHFFLLDILKLTVSLPETSPGTNWEASRVKHAQKINYRCWEEHSPKAKRAPQEWKSNGDTDADSSLSCHLHCSPGRGQFPAQWGQGRAGQRRGGERGSNWSEACMTLP